MLVGIRHVGGGCNAESRPPAYILRALENSDWHAGLACQRCQAYRPLDEFEGIPA